MYIHVCDDLLLQLLACSVSAGGLDAVVKCRNRPCVLVRFFRQPIDVAQIHRISSSSSWA